MYLSFQGVKLYWSSNMQASMFITKLNKAFTYVTPFIPTPSCNIAYSIFWRIVIDYKLSIIYATYTSLSSSSRKSVCLTYLSHQQHFTNCLQIQNINVTSWPVFLYSQGRACICRSKFNHSNSNRINISQCMNEFLVYQIHNILLIHQFCDTIL